jgi:hypothetical protein
MSLIVLGKILDTFGKLFIAYAALKVHHRVLRDHKIDKKVFTVMQREQIIGIIGFIFIIVGSMLEIVTHL